MIARENGDVMKFAFVFPGQGSQSIGMMKGFEQSTIVRQTFTEASDVLNIDLWKMTEEGPDAVLGATVNTQPIMLTAGVAVYRAWLEAGGAKPTVMAGHSLGEYSALVAAGAIAFTDAVELVRLRAVAMQEAVPEGLGAMAAVLGMDDALLIETCRDAAKGEVLQAVNFNSPGQVVIAGDKAAVERGIELCKERGAKRAILLPVSVPSHCELMRPAAARLAEKLANVTVSSPVIPVLHNADVISVTDPEAIKDALVRQLYSPVRWVETMQAIAAMGITQMAECGPGKVLASLAKRIDPALAGSALTELGSFEVFGQKISA